MDLLAQGLVDLFGGTSGFSRAIVDGVVKGDGPFEKSATCIHVVFYGKGLHVFCKVDATLRARENLTERMEKTVVPTAVLGRRWVGIAQSEQVQRLPSCGSPYGRMHY